MSCPNVTSLRRLWRVVRWDTTTALEVATTELVWCDATATVAEVAEEMCYDLVRLEESIVLQRRELDLDPHKAPEGRESVPVTVPGFLSRR